MSIEAKVVVVNAIAGNEGVDYLGMALKKHIVTFPYKDNFSEDDIPTKSRPCTMNAELVEFYKTEIDSLLQKGLIKPSKSLWSCTAFYVNNATEKDCGVPRMDPPWVTEGRGKGNNPRGKGRSSLDHHTDPRQTP
ncbi:hypothetical protein MTR67_006831 [Solanum verrucosum]|uniref:Uncharacterized protein n=1 Tax=Solanum verrucosum TaxID=315347 RepID=A0AAF0TC68_SOLVR|nr:hypothetical protein MTR67_006831 [Solanum verrucosum]